VQVSASISWHGHADRGDLPIERRWPGWLASLEPIGDLRHCWVVLRTPRQRHSRAALKRLEGADSARTIVIALAANLVIAASKLAAGLLSGSTGMLAESAHSFADSLSEVLLGISLRRARVPPDDLHPLGHGRERFLWAFLAAVASFLIGGCVSVALAVRALEKRVPAANALAAWIVLAVSFAADGTSWLQSVAMARRQAREYGQSVWRYLLHASEPLARAIVVEDSAALVGLLIAAGGLLASHLSGTSTPDSVASLLIGILLAITAFGLAKPLADFLVGRSLSPERLDELRAIIAASPAIAEIQMLQAVYIGPEEAIVTAKVNPSPGQSTEELARAMDDLDHAIREASPLVADVYLDVTAHRDDATPGKSVSLSDERRPESRRS
jgi:cation diffusion facilitator family transporter